MYSVPGLIERFDRRINGKTSLTGKLSPLIGEMMLIEVLAHAVVTEGRTVELINGQVPHRDAEIMPTYPTGWTPRDLDAWFILGGETLAAVEVKTWTASALGGRSVDDTRPEQLAEIAAARRAEAAEDLALGEWTQTNKVGMPLRAPNDWAGDTRTENFERYLAFWRPVASDGLRPWSESMTRTQDHRGKRCDVRVRVFSASLYLRDLHWQGIQTLPARLTRPEEILDALGEVVVR